MSDVKVSTTILVNAKKLLEKVGWVQGTYTKFENDTIIGHCAAGAIFNAFNALDLPTSDPLYQARQRFNQVVGISADAISRWNDQPTRTKEEVLAAFDRAIQENE